MTEALGNGEHGSRGNILGMWRPAGPEGGSSSPRNYGQQYTYISSDKLHIAITDKYNCLPYETMGASRLKNSPLNSYLNFSVLSSTHFLNS
jgi:hypothetical protein